MYYEPNMYHLPNMQENLVEKQKSGRLNIVLTGGNNGIGFETAKVLYNEGHNIVFGSRNIEKNEAAVK